MYIYIEKHLYHHLHDFIRKSIKIFKLYNSVIYHFVNSNKCKQRIQILIYNI